MAEKSDKKTNMILLIILAISVIGGGIWTYNTFGISEIYSNGQDNVIDPELQEVFRIKDASIQNIGDFLGFKNISGNIWDNFYADKQVTSLKDIDVEIDIDEYKNNPNPFVIPTKKEEK